MASEAAASPRKPMAAAPNDWCHTKVTHTEHRDSFRAPVVRPQVRTRAYHMDRFLWATISKAIEQRERADEQQRRNDMHGKTEYADGFGTVAADTTAADAALKYAYPLYDTAAITVWCPQVMHMAPFKRDNRLTQPNAECYDQQFR